MTRRNLLALLAAGPLAAAQEPDASTTPPVFKVDVSLITIDARVTNPEGADAGDLTVSDFIVFDENERQKVTHFGRESTPIDLLLLLDVSVGMRPFLIELTPRVTDALSPLRPGDRAGVMLFADTALLVQPLTGDLQLVPRAAVNTIYKDGAGRATLLNDALIRSAQYLLRQPATGRRTIIVLTDSQATSGAASENDVIRELHAANAVLNAILLGVKGDIPKMTPGYRDPSNRYPDLSRFVDATGGDLVSDDEPARALRRVVQESTTRYSLQYPAPAGEPGTFRRVRVELSGAAAARHPGATVKARTGYDVPK
jgi:VWFA-related protein